MDIERFIRHAMSAWDLSGEDIVIANGSFVEGFGNSRSDIDCWVVFPNQSRRSNAVPNHVWLDGFRINPAAYPRTRVLDLANAINSVAVDDHAAVAQVQINALDRYYRAAAARTIVNAPAFEEIRAHFRRQHVGELLRVWAGIHCATALSNARTFQNLEDGTRTLLATRLAFECAVDSFLAASGEISPALKWRFEKLGRLVGSDSDEFRQAWRLKSPGEMTADVYLAEVENYCSSHGMADFHPGRVPPKQKGNVRLFRIAGDNFLISRKVAAFSPSEEGSFVWEQLDGIHDLEEIAAAVRRRFSIQEEREALLLAHSVVAEFAAAGLVERS